LERSRRVTPDAAAGFLRFRLRFREEHSIGRGLLSHLPPVVVGESLAQQRERRVDAREPGPAEDCARFLAAAPWDEPERFHSNRALQAKAAELADRFGAPRVTLCRKFQGHDADTALYAGFILNDEVRRRDNAHNAALERPHARVGDTPAERREQ
jgi:hypothetical protein